jgi:hypothetical protein
MPGAARGRPRSRAVVAAAAVLGVEEEGEGVLFAYDVPTFVLAFVLATSNSRLSF